MMINRNNIETINELCLHDMELSGIKIDYFGHVVEIYLYDRQDRYVLLFECMQSFSITGVEPWGEGMYVYEIKATTNFTKQLIKVSGDYIINDEAFMTEILLNSGDRINIIASSIQFAKDSRLSP